MLHLYVHLHMFACMAPVLKFPIHACVVYTRLQKMFDEMKTSMHRIARYIQIFYKWYQSLAYNVDLMRYLVCLCFSSDIQKIMVLRMVFKWQLRLVSCIKGPFFTPQHHLVVITSPHFLTMHMCNSQIVTLSTYVGGANATNLGL